jgi:hypothetical protein
MKPDVAALELAVMEAILADYEEPLVVRDLLETL